MITFLKKIIFFSFLLINFENLNAADNTDNQDGGIIGWLKSFVPARKPTPQQIVKSEAEQLIKLEVFSPYKDPNNPAIKVKTTLSQILDAHDQLYNLIISAKQLRNGIYDEAAFSEETINQLKSKEKALRKVINMIWGALMIDPNCREDVDTFMATKSAPALFCGTGFEWMNTHVRPVPLYSFPDKGDSAIYIAQIREMSASLGIDLDATLYFPFDPESKIKRSQYAIDFLRSKMSYKAIRSETGEEEKHAKKVEAYFCMLNILKLVADEAEFDADSADIPLGQKQLDIERLQSARNHLKFKLFMDEAKVRDIDGGRARQLILNIVNRLNGIVPAVPSAASVMVTSARGDTDSKETDDAIMLEMNPFNHRDFESVPYGSPLKPITTAGYRASESVLRAYWERTESVLSKAEEIIGADGEVLRASNITRARSFELYDRVQHLISNTLWCMKNYTTRNTTTAWSPFVTEMFKHLDLETSGYAFYTGDLADIIRQLPREKASSSKKGSEDRNWYVFGEANSTEIGLHILGTLETEFERVQALRA